MKKFLLVLLVLGVCAAVCAAVLTKGFTEKDPYGVVPWFQGIIAPKD